MKLKTIKTATSPPTNLLPFCIEDKFVGRDKGLDIIYYIIGWTSLAVLITSQ